MKPRESTHTIRFFFGGRPGKRIRGLTAVSARLLFILGMAVSPAFATDHFNLESGIPTSLEDIEPIESGNFELQTFAQYQRLREEKNAVQTEPRLVWGIFEKTQIDISTPLLLGEGAANGNGDVQISVLRKLRDDSKENPWPGFALEAELRLPTGVERPGFKNRADAGLTALIKEDVGIHSFHVNAGFDWTGDKSEEEPLRRDVWSAALGHDMPLTGRVVLVSDVAWRQADDKDARDIWLLETGVRAQLAPELIGGLGIGAGLNRGPETPIFTLTAGFQLGL